MTSGPRPTLLLLAQALPADSGIGVAMRLGHWVRSLAPRHCITLVVVSSDRTVLEQRIDAEWRERLHEVRVLDARGPEAAAGPRRSGMRPALWSRWPLGEIEAALRELRGAHFDAVLAFRLRLWPVWQMLRDQLGLRAGRVVLDLDDVESVAHLRQVRALGWRHYGRLGFVSQLAETLRLRHAEAEAHTEADAVCVCSSLDQARLERRFGPGKAFVVPNGVSPRELLAPRAADGRTHVLFVGALSYAPNEQAVRWLVDEIEPALRARLGAEGLQCVVAGRSPPPWMRGLSHVRLCADVPDLVPLYEQADIVVVPLKMGGGTRIKILEAMLLGRPVLSTRIGAEGLDLTPGVHFLQCDTTAEFVAAVAELAARPQRALELVHEARAHVLQRFGSERIAQSIHAAIGGPTMADFSSAGTP